MSDIVTFEGPMGRGKTVTAVGLAVEEHKETGRKIISNTPLKGVEYTQFSLEWFVKALAGEEIEDAIMIWDEAYQLFDAHLSNNKVVRLMGYFDVQTRKRDVDLYVCTHHILNLELRFRRAVSIRGTCNFFEELPCKMCKGTGVFKDQTCPRCLGAVHLKTLKTTGQRVTFVGFSNTFFKRVKGRERPKRFTIPMWVNPYFSYFDTKARVPIQKKLLDVDTSEVAI